MRIAIVGAGIMGQLSALALSEAGHQLTLFEQSPARSQHNCSSVAAGMLSSLSELEKSELDIYHLGQDSLNEYWPKILSQLPSSVYFSKLGTLLVSHPQDTAELIRYVDLVSSKLSDTAQIKKLTSNELIDREPQLVKFKEAYYFADEAQIDNQSLMLNLEIKLKQLAIDWRQETYVTQVAAHTVSYGQAVESFDWVIDCRGLGAKDQFEDLRAVRGELLWLKAPEVKIKHLIRLLHPRYSLYLAPRPDDIYILGASEIEAEDYSQISVRTALELLSAAYYVHPGFAEARVIKTMTHCRPTLADHKPKIKFMQGLIAVNGLYRHGFLIAPALAQELACYLKEGLQAVKYSRFWENINVKNYAQ